MIPKIAPDSLSYSGMHLQALCRKVLRVQPERLDQNLFEVGLNSLSAASLAWLIEQEFNVRIRLSEILNNPTIRKLLASIEIGQRHGSRSPGIKHVDGLPHPKSIPLSFAQEQVWFLEKLHPQINSYRFQALLHCVGTLNPDVLERSLDWIVSRHEILRTAFVADNGESPRQQVGAHIPLVLPREDLRLLAEKEREAELHRRINEELRRPFNPSAPPLIRWRLYRLGEQECSLLHTEHHFVHDGWSYGIFLEELYATYRALINDEHLRTESEPPPQFSEFALWQRQMVASGAWDDQLDYWRRELTDCPPPPLLPSDRRLGPHRSFAGCQIRRNPPQGFWTELGTACSREGVTRFTWIQAVFHLFIHLYTGALDFCTGTGFANRRNPRFQKMLGMAINTLPIRARLRGIDTFRDLLRRTHDTLRFALDNQELAFETIVKDLNPGRDPNINPFFNAFIAAYDTAYPAFYDESLEITSEDGISCGEVKFDLVALLIPRPAVRDNGASVDQIAPRLLWEFSSELFDFSTGESMLDHFLALLEASVREPESALAHLSAARGSELDRVLSFGKGPEAPSQCEIPLHRLFESVAAASPSAPALVAGETVLNYGELNVRANKFARRLRELGFLEGSVAAVAMPRSPEAIVCFLAILKAGGAYLPIDLRDPRDRIASLLRSAKAAILLTHSDPGRALPLAEAEVCLVDEPFEAAEGNLSLGVSASSPAYVLFTSGSTGLPKGVIVPHRAVSRLVFGMTIVSLDRSEILLNLAPLSFDASTFEIWGALLHGAQLVVSLDDFPDFRSLGEIIFRHKITTMWLTCSLFNQIIDTSPEILRGVRQILTGGEALSPSHVRKALDLLPGTRIVNGYGPTETTTFATIYQVPNGLQETSRSVPIGRPIAGTQVYVVSDRNGRDRDKLGHGIPKMINPAVNQLTPIGIPGELYIGGEGVALGYLNFPELTLERFVADPFGISPARRLYKTGDRVRWHPDGNLDFLGRIDDQLKIRGFRIEPGEIEAVLERHPSVSCAIVKMWESAAGEKCLVGYYEPDRHSSAEPAALLEFLGSQLPRYMVPVSLIKVEKLPLTATGKIDQLALTQPQRHSGETSFTAECTATEQIVSNVFANVLRAVDFDTRKSFFELGGDSLLAVRVVTALAGILHIEIPVPALFNNPTVSTLSRHLDAIVAHDLGTVRPPIERVSRDQPLPLSFAQERLWRNERDAASPDNVTVIVLDLRGDLNIPGLERSLQELVRRHEVLRTTFDVVGDSPVQRIAPFQPFTLNVLDLSQTPDAQAEAERFARKEKTDSISLEHGPLMRFSVLRFETCHYWLVLKLHHILYDIWSLPIFARELDILYRVFCLGKDSPLPELTVHLADFAVWQRRYLDRNSSAFQGQLAYWRKQLAGNLPVLKLGCERTHELKTASTDDVQVPFEIAGELSASIRTLTKREGTTLFITFLTTLKALINVSTGQDDIMLGIYMAKRNATEADRMMGYFCDLGVLRTRVSNDLSFVELLCRVRKTVLNAHAYEDMPFSVLAEELARCGQHPPDLRAIFLFESFSEQFSRLGDLEVNQLAIASRTTMPWGYQMRVRDEGGAFSGWAKFDARQYDPQLVRRMLRNYVKLLEAVVREPAARLCEAATKASLERLESESAPHA